MTTKSPRRKMTPASQDFVGLCTALWKAWNVSYTLHHDISLLIGNNSEHIFVATQCNNAYSWVLLFTSFTQFKGWPAKVEAVAYPDGHWTLTVRFIGVKPFTPKWFPRTWPSIKSVPTYNLREQSNQTKRILKYRLSFCVMTWKLKTVEWDTDDKIVMFPFIARLSLD